MSLLADTAFGIDLDDGTLKIVKLSRRGRRVTLRRTWRVACHDVPDPYRAALAALAELVPTLRLGPSARVVVGAPDARAFCGSYLLPALDQAQLEEMVTYEVLRTTGLPAADLIVRFHVRKGLPDQQVHAFAPHRRDVNGLRADLDRHHVPFDDMASPAFALASFVDLEDPYGQDRLVLGVGQHATQLVLLTERGIWARRLPFGLFHEPDGTTLAVRLKAEVDSAALFFLPKDRPFRPRDIVLTEEGALDASLTGALRSVTGVTVQRFSSLRRITTPSRPAWEGQTGEQVLCMGKAFGLALSGLGLGRFACPLLGTRRGRDASRRLPAVAAGLVLSSVGLIAAAELASERSHLLDRTLPAARAGEVRQLARRRDRLREEHGIASGAVRMLQSVAGSRQMVFEVRHALDVLTTATHARSDRLHVDHLWLSTGGPGEKDRLNLTLSAVPSLPEETVGRLHEAFRREFSQALVRGPEVDTAEDGTRFVVEIQLP